jgi:hypothetical protein
LEGFLAEGLVGEGLGTGKGRLQIGNFFSGVA